MHQQGYTQKKLYRQTVKGSRLRGPDETCAGGKHEMVDHCQGMVGGLAMKMPENANFKRQVSFRAAFRSLFLLAIFLPLLGGGGRVSL